jgi:hypothetical protein
VLDGELNGDRHGEELDGAVDGEEPMHRQQASSGGQAGSRSGAWTGQRGRQGGHSRASAPHAAAHWPLRLGAGRGEMTAGRSAMKAWVAPWLGSGRPGSSRQIWRGEGATVLTGPRSFHRRQRLTGRIEQGRLLCGPLKSNRTAEIAFANVNALAARRTAAL